MSLLRRVPLARSSPVVPLICMSGIKFFGVLAARLLDACLEFIGSRSSCKGLPVCARAIAELRRHRMQPCINSRAAICAEKGGFSVRADGCEAQEPPHPPFFWRPSRVVHQRSNPRGSFKEREISASDRTRNSKLEPDTPCLQAPWQAPGLVAVARY